MPAALAPEGIEIVGACYRGQLKSWVYSGTMPAALAPEGIEIVGPFYSGAMRVALATGRIEKIVGAFYNGD